MNRLSNDEIFLGQALIASGGSTCLRRAVGCVLVDTNKFILAIGRNGAPRGMPHCIDEPCLGANLPSGQGLDLCMSSHAEQSALLRCKDPMTIHKCYCTTSPCIHCVKMIMNTSCKEIIFLDEYPAPESQKLFTSIEGNIWKQFTYTKELFTIKELINQVRQ